MNELLKSPESMEQIMKLARSLSGNNSDEQKSEAEQGGHGNTQQNPQPPDFGGIDPRLMGLFGAALKEYGSPSDKYALISALKPYLKSDRREKIDKALQIAKLAKVAKTVIPEFGGTKNV
ncbi:MAG: hypothetical protein GX250_01365 [Clostridiales bacterium]|nr:hypothetical protein [Clostridiales bacterium]